MHGNSEVTTGKSERKFGWQESIDQGNGYLEEISQKSVFQFTEQWRKEREIQEFGGVLQTLKTRGNTRKQKFFMELLAPESLQSFDSLKKDISGHWKRIIES